MKLAIVVALVLTNAVMVHSRLGGPKKPPTPPAAPFGLSLWLSGEVFENRTVSDEGFGYFIGNVSIGGQSVRMLFDLTADRSWVISTGCETASCQEHSRYTPRALMGETVSLRMSSDSGDETDTIYGELASDRVCVGKRLGNESSPEEAACTDIELISVNDIDEGLIVRQRFDGIIGLSNPTASKLPKASFLNQLNLAGLPHQFGFYVSDSGWNAELLFGGYDKRRLESEITWAPLVQDSHGFWMVKVRGISVGGRNIGACKSMNGCNGLFQIGTPTITMHEGTLPKVQSEISRHGLEGSEGCHLPDLSFELEGGVSLDLKVEDYVGSHCAPELRSHTWSDTKFGAEVLILGEPIFRRYYTVFDWVRRRLGFGRAKVERHCGRLGRAGLPVEDCVETEEVILFQTEVKWDEL